MPTGEWQSFMADRLPIELDDAIKKKHADFYMAQKELTPTELMDVLPISFPVTHNLPEFPGVSIYPIDAWEEAGSPMLTVVGWVKLCVRISKKNFERLESIFEAAQKVDQKVANEEKDQCDLRASAPPASAASSSTV